MIINLCFAACAALEFILVPYFLEASKDGRNKKSQIFKAICSTLFLVAGILAWVIANNQSDYAKYNISKFHCSCTCNFLSDFNCKGNDNNKRKYINP